MIYRRFPRLMPIAVLTVCALSAQDTNTFIYETRQLYKDVSTNLLKSAEAMPPEDFQFRPTPESPTFGESIREVSAYQEDVCSVADTMRVDLNGVFPGDKTDLVEMLQRSVRRCDAAYASINNFTASQEVNFAGKRQSRLGLLSMNASHCSEVYGNLVVYLRLKGIIPPSKRARLLPVKGD